MEKLRILVVDDEMGMRLGVMRALRNFKVDLPDIGSSVNLELDQAETGEAGLEKIHSENPPDIVLLDHKLPGIHGLDVLDKVVQEKLDLLVVMITAYASLETAVSATKKGAYDFLAKPFTPDELKSTIQKTAKHLLLRRNARKLAEEKRQVRFQFISVLAHELKSPLAAVEGYLHILEDPTTADNEKMYNQIVERSLIRVEGMRKLILDLLDLTRIESGKKKRELKDVDLINVLSFSVENVTPDANKRDIQINLDTPEELHMTADRGEIEIILNNLLTNAVKYNKDGGSVDVDIEDTENTAIINVADTGIGMEKEDVEKLFQEFTRIKNEKTKNILGSGLGLSILKKLVDMYNGEIDVESEPNVGTTFTITLKKHVKPEKEQSE
jgi:signal transduction histidine kinase